MNKEKLTGLKGDVPIVLSKWYDTVYCEVGWIFSVGIGCLAGIKDNYQL